MASQSNHRLQTGFTIVETMIVLGIAGLILLIVFEAIPTLERNSRNNQRKQDIQTITGVISQYELDNSANLPAQPTLRAKLTNKLTFYYLNNVSICTHNIGQSACSLSAVNNGDVVSIYNHALCSSTTQGTATSIGAGYNDVVALYGIETGSNGVGSECQQL
jgi:type II secretory pathway pseudopilin PulG